MPYKDPTSEAARASASAARLRYQAKPESKAKAAAEQKARRQTEQGRNYYLTRTYGITLDQYNELFAKQNGVCALCQKPETTAHKNGTVFNLAVDHCHETNEVRGLLCHRCNRALGLLGDTREAAKRLHAYLG